MKSRHSKHYTRQDIIRLAVDAMFEQGLEPVFSASALSQLESVHRAASDHGPAVRDLTRLLWCSIDNDDSMDLDQITASEALADGATRIWVAIADVDALVPVGSPIDGHAQNNTATIYTSGQVFPMLPEKLSTDLTSLGQGQERLALVSILDIDAEGEVGKVELVRARVLNRAKLAYDAVSAWLEDKAPMPAAMAAVPGLAEQVRVQDAVAQTLKQRRHRQGLLEFELFEPKAVFHGDEVVGIDLQEHNRARQLIEELMIATNQGTARFLAAAGHPSFRRVVRSPERWRRIVDHARRLGESLPDEPDAKALALFLARQHRADPVRFPDLSLVIVKLMGSGEYVVEGPGETPIGHFGLAVRDYTHSTAPNRRFPDLITQRMVKAVLGEKRMPYPKAELQRLAEHCTHQEDVIRKIERRIRKSEAALLLSSHINQRFDAIVTGSTPSATWVRLLQLPVEGMLIEGLPDLAVGSRIRVRLVSTDVEKGYIDFAQSVQ